MRVPQFAQTLRDVAKGGKEAFYKGRIAASIASTVQALGGWLTEEDLSDHLSRGGSEEVDPIAYHYAPQGEAGVELVEHPPNGQGLTALIALGLVDAMQEEGLVPDLSTLVPNSVEWLHVVIEALRLAFADARQYIADPAHTRVPVPELLSKPYLRRRVREHFDPQKASADVQHGSPEQSCDTVYFTVSDKWGNAASFINSVYTGFGSGIVAKDCGFALQNRGAGFMLHNSHPNCVAPSKRPYHTIIPAMVLRPRAGPDGGRELFMSYGVMGAWMQPQGHLQVLLNILHAHNTPQAALDAPRLCIGPGIPRGLGGPVDSRVWVEEGISDHVVEQLKQLGHDVRQLKGFTRSMFGRGQVIMRLRHSDLAPLAHGETASAGSEGHEPLVWAAGSDQRGDGQATAQV